VRPPTLATLEQLATFLRGDADAAFLGALSDEDWFALFVVSNRDGHRLVPALCGILSRTDIASVVPPEVRNYLELVERANERRNAAVRSELLDVVAVLNKASVEPMLLKGAAALMDGRRAVMGRIVGDLDLLVPEEREADALAALRGAGFQEIAPPPEVSHTIADLERLGAHALIDLHREVLEPPFRNLLSAAELLSRADRFDTDGLLYTLPSLQDHALYSMLHAQVHHRGYFSRVLCLGAARDMAILDEAVDWREMEHWAETHRMRVALDATLLDAEHFLGLRWPLSRSPARTAIQHHQRACQVEITGGWDVGFGRVDRLRELFAADRLSIGFGANHWYIANVARLFKRGLQKYGVFKLFRRLARP
jgi:Uncharacterised nucleotidyltransferase